MQSITLQTNDSVISSGDALGQVQFAASAESDGGASRLIGAKIYAQGEGAFNASSNPTSIIFATSAADNLPASGKIKIDDNGNIIPLLTQNYNLGSSSSEFANLYVSDSIYISGIALIDGSNYTIGADTYSLASGVIVDGGDSSSANVDLLFRRDLDSEWESNNPVLASGEPGWDITNKVLKVGNGIDAWNDLEGITGGSTLDLSYSRGFFLLNEPSGTFTVNGGYTVGYLDVYMNGVKLFPSGDYTATDGTTFSLTDVAQSGSLIEYLVPAVNVSSSTATFDSVGIGTTPTAQFHVKNGNITDKLLLESVDGGATREEYIFNLQTSGVYYDGIVSESGNSITDESGNLLLGDASSVDFASATFPLSGLATSVDCSLVGYNITDSGSAGWNIKSMINNTPNLAFVGSESMDSFVGPAMTGVDIGLSLDAPNSLNVVVTGVSTAVINWAGTIKLTNVH